MEFVDRQISCIDCNQPFTFTAGEQEFYDRKGFKEEPKRCKPCREARKSRRNAQLTDGVSAAGSGGHAVPAHDDDSFGNRAPGSAVRGPREVREPRGGGGARTGAVRGPRSARASDEREMFDAVCAQCGAQTRVPFRPVAGRPVYCRECFGGRRGVGGSM